MDNSNLVTLIKSLKKSELRYVTLYLSKNKENSNSLKLYKIISENTFINNDEIVKKINDKNFSSQLRQTKYALYQLILDALHQFDSRKSPYAHILIMLHQSEILLNRKMLTARSELLLKASQLADKYELPELKLEILKLHIRDMDEFRVSKNETKQLFNKITQNTQLKHLYNKIAVFQEKKGYRITLTQQKKLTGILQRLKNKNSKPDSLFGKYFYFHSLMVYYKFSSGDVNERYAIGLKLLKLFKQHPEILRLPTWRIRYFFVLSDLITTSVMTFKIKTLELVRNEIKNLDISNSYKSDLDVINLDAYIQQGEFKRGEKYLNDIQTNLPDGLTLHNRFVLYLNIAIMNFGLGIYSKALFWLNEVLKNPAKQLADFPYTGIAQIIRLITYYELKKFDLLEYELRSTFRSLLKQGNSFKIDQLILDYLPKMISTNNNKHELLKVTEEAWNKLIILSKIKTEAKMLEFFDFISWFESKIENKSFAEVVKKNRKNKLKAEQALNKVYLINEKV